MNFTPITKYVVSVEKKYKFELQKAVAMCFKVYAKTHKQQIADKVAAFLRENGIPHSGRHREVNSLPDDQEHYHDPD
jgi:hypothetical protein